ncbi:ATP-binding protein [Pseudomonas sp.]|uniref:ATP-binding protein n=1 Tax=Pseudomonas sp. TaxID=306 RepID=UPI00257F6E84|nr:ATP-binding protein [Pseudomonas sp.]
MEKEFAAFDFSGSNAITHSGIQKHFKSVEPWQAISELIWNGFDAAANAVKVYITENEAHGTESITVVDDGVGINFRKPHENFRRFNDSLKKDSYDTHGSQGRGRLAFSKIGNSAVWYTRHEGEDAKISVESSNLSDIVGVTIRPETTHALLSSYPQGTCVEIRGFQKALPVEAELIHDFSREFGGHLILLSHKSLTLNGKSISPPSHSIYTHTVSVDGQNFSVELIRWHERPGSEKSFINFVSSTLKVLNKQLSSLNKKPGYFTSIYVKSDLFERYSVSDQGLHEPFSNFFQTKSYRTLTKALNEFLRDNYSEFLVQQAEEEVNRYEQDGDFPTYDDLDSVESAWRLNHVKGIVKSVIVRDPTVLMRSSKRQRRLIIRLLDKLSVSNENDGMIEVLESVLSLDAASMKQFAIQLNKTKLNNVIETIEVLQNREHAIAQLKQVINVHFRDVLETPDLQKVIESNTWLFGPSYDILGAEEDTFTKISERLRAQVTGVGIVEEMDLEAGVDLVGAKRQVDLFLARKKPEFDSRGRKYFRCVIIEIKRPGISLNNKHLQQLDEYASVLSNDPVFNSEHVKFELVLVGRNISSKGSLIHSRCRGMQIHGEPGLVTSDDKVKAYVKTWATIFDEFELTNDYLLEKLKTQRADLDGVSKKDLIAELQGEEAPVPSV